MTWPNDSELALLDDNVQHAFATGDESELEVLGYGEISAVLALRTERASFACKRLPPFPSHDSREAYRDIFERYVARLDEHDIHPVESTLLPVGESILYCVQPLLDPATLAVKVFAAAGPEERVRLFERIAERIAGAVGPSLGLDAQLSNWVVTADGSLRYLDLTTPMMRDEDGREQLETAVFLASLPWALRGLVRRFMLGSILQTYYDPRAALIDFLANLYKEKLADPMPALLEAANRRLETPIDDSSVRKYYRDDARTWELLLRLRRADRGWQRRVRRRPYPFLLPGPIAR